VVTRSGGITYNVRVGDRAIGWASDHTEPGVSVRNRDEGESAALAVLSCVGNDAFVVTSEGKGSRGTVTGKHGGNQVLVDFTREVMEQLTIGDRIQVRAYGRGLRLLDAPEVKLHSVSVELLEALPLEIADGVVTVPVAGIVPPELMGAGLGGSAERSDYDIQTADRAVLAEHGLASLRLGDIVAIRDHDDSFGHGYRRGAWTIASVAHADSLMAGHGPGVNVLLTSAAGKLRPRLDPARANIADLLKLRA
jgi:Domain of unknown function (DUF4438), N-terminal/Domain of unknown function (DUF4438), C-terminal